jgi:hypothetical protein
VVADWYALYPARLGIAGNGPITDGMRQYYAGWYRSAATPMLIIEHCIGADGGGMRADRPTPQAAAAADYAVLTQQFGLGTQQPATEIVYAPGNPIAQIPMQHPFSSRWMLLNGQGLALPQMGWPEKAERRLTNGRRVQRFQRGWFATQDAPNPWDVVLLPPEEAATLGL